MHPGISGVYIYEITSWPGQNVPGGTPLFKPYRYVPRQRVWFFAPFWSENWYRLCPFWSGIGNSFQGATVVYKHIFRLVPN